MLCAGREAVFMPALAEASRRGTRQREWNLVTDQTPEINYNQPGDTELPNDQTEPHASATSATAVDKNAYDETQIQVLEGLGGSAQASRHVHWLHGFSRPASLRV